MTKLKNKKQIVKTGDVVAIPLPDGKFAFGLQFGDVTAIYSIVTNGKGGPPIGHRKFLFATGIYNDVLSNPAWAKVGKDIVTQSEIEFVSLGFVYDDENDSYELYSPFFDEYVKPSTKEECFGLEMISAWDSHCIIDRIVSSLKNKKTEWLKDCPWIPFAIDLSNRDDMRRVPLGEVLQ